MITNEKLIAQCLTEASNILNGMSVLTEAVIEKDDSDLPYDIWLDCAGKNRKVSHNMPRVKIVVDGKRIPIIVPTKRGAKPKICTSKSVDKISRIYKFILKYNDVFLMCFNKDSPIFDVPNSQDDKMIGDIFKFLLKYNDREKAFDAVIKKYKISNIKPEYIMSDDYKHMANNF